MAAYDVNYDDERFTQVEADKQEALTDLEKTYSGMIDKSDKFYQDQINASKEWADTQVDIQNQNTEFALQKIEQQKQQAQKDYIKEQSGAYADWRKQSNEYGAESEKMASAGLQRTGFSESSQVSMYNTYQNRVAMARDSINRAMLNFDNGINEARLQNNSAIAEIRYNALKEQLSLSLQGFQYKNQLIETLTSKKTETEQIYYNRYQDVLAQINHENAMAAEVRRYSQDNDDGGIIDKPSATGQLGSMIGEAVGQAAKKASNAFQGKGINSDSVLALGYGPISDAKLASLITQGKVMVYSKNGEYYVKHNPMVEKMKAIWPGF